MDNLKEFKELIERYESITLDEIKSQWDKTGSFTARELTGFGTTSTCSLCIAVNNDCFKCTWGNKDMFSCKGYHSFETYNLILSASTPLELKKAYRERAKNMLNILKEIDGK